jgi:hypothetical protein
LILAKKVFFYVLLLLTVLFVSLVASVFLFQEQIIKQFIAEANERLGTPIKIKSIEVSALENFPNLSIVFYDVYVEDSHAGQYPLLTANQISFQLNPIEVYRGIYTIRGLEITECETNLKINKEGKSNFNIVKESSKQSEAIGFELKNVKLKNVLVHYVDYAASHDLKFETNQLTTFIKNANDVYAITLDGDITSKQIRIDNNTLLENKTFHVQGNLIYNHADKHLQIEPTQLSISKSQFLLKGEYQWKKQSAINLSIDGKNTDIQTLLSLLPQKTVENFKQYKSEGEAYFSATIKGDITPKKNPSISVEFGMRNATIIYPETKARIENANLEGSFASSNITELKDGVLVLKNLNGTLNKNPFKANLVIRNFSDAEVIFNFKGLLDAASVHEFYPQKEVASLTGQLNVDVSFEGRLSLLKSKQTAQQASTAGSIEMLNLNFLFGSDRVPVKNLSGMLQFNKNDMALSDVTATVGNSDVLLNGFFKNVITFLLFENQPIGIEADLKSDFLDVEQLFALAYTEDAGKSQDYIFKISPNIYLNFNCDVKKLHYKRFTARKLTGDLLVKNQMAVSKKIVFNAMGGKLSLSGIVDANNSNAIDVIATAKVNEIYADSLFYVFKNFNQTFIEAQHLKGQATADINFELVLNERLKLIPSTLVADISTTIKNGELINFEPLKKLNKYLDDEGLSKLKFADLKNDIHIENKTVYIPQMQVRNNVTTLQISGTHTFDQQIDYHVVAPLINKSKINVTEAADALENQAGQLKLYLRFVGSTDNYQVKYDTDAVRKKIASDLKKEVQELKDAFKNKGVKKKKELELSSEEFDWDNLP